MKHLLNIRWRLKLIFNNRWVYSRSSYILLSVDIMLFQSVTEYVRNDLFLIATRKCCPLLGNVVRFFVFFFFFVFVFLLQFCSRSQTFLLMFAVSCLVVTIVFQFIFKPVISSLENTEFLIALA